MNNQKISIIIPVFNDEKLITKCVDSLLDQSYPKELYDIIVVDNNSIDNTKKVLEQYKENITVLDEKDKQSSYAARNRAIKHTNSNLFAFIDSDCIADEDWLKNGVEELEKNKADLLGGKVEFYFNKNSAAEYFDALYHFDFEKTIKEKKATGAGNLFVKRKVFDGVGLFSEVKSGGDFEWTNKAYQKGFKLVYSPITVVKHPTRNLKELLKKKVRTGGGGLSYLKGTKKTKKEKFQSLAKLLKPERIKNIKLLITKRGTEDMNKKIFKIWVIANLLKIATIYGAMKSVFKK